MKHISQIDNIDSLREFVRNELREFGIKIPKIKKSKRGVNKAQYGVKSSLFGSSLAHAQCAHIEDCGYVAQFLVDAAEIVEENINCEGIFRKSGALSRQKEIKHQLENGTGFKGANVHDVTAIVKQFFRELPEPLLTSMYHNSFIRCYQMDNENTAVKAILLLCLLLPGEHLSTLRFIMLLLAKVAANSETNKMDTTNLAVVLAPNIMHVNSKTETMKSCEEKLLQAQTSVVDLLIRNADQIGMVEDLLAKEAAYMSEIFSTDDELDASEDNLEDTAETRKKEKKRKRSGSFQGFVSSIAQSITKWRRSTDGKTNTSNMSQASNVSHISNSSHQKVDGAREDQGQDKQAVFQFSAADAATPVVRRKKVPQMSEGRAFSASKKKAILKNLPQQATLASTPFTPASTMKRMDINSSRRAGNLETPSMPPRPYQCTPRLNAKTPRKKLTLFSPASTTKKKRYSSTTNLSVQSAGKKTGKTKGIFRRLSGTKGDQIPDRTAANPSSRKQIGHRLASPNSNKANSSVTSTKSGRANHSVKGNSPVSATVENSLMSASLSEQSIVSVYDDERRSLNEGFIMSDEKEVDITRIMSEPALAGSHESGEYVMLGNVFPRETLSDTTILAESRSETPRGHSRSFSVDSILDNSARKSSLKRGKPNSIKAGLLQGDQREVHKLRRSFGFDKSDIGFPVPVSVADTSNCDHYIQLDNTMEDLLDSNHYKASNVALDTDPGESGDSPGSVSRNKVSTTSVADSMTGYECDDEQSEVGVSSVPVNKDSLGSLGLNQPDNEKVEVKKTLVDQKQESKDSLLSSTSASLTPPVQVRDREMTRSVSADSGKGSLCEEPMEEGDNATLDSVSSSVLDQKDNSVLVTETIPDQCPITQTILSEKSLLVDTEISDHSLLFPDQKSDISHTNTLPLLQNKKSVSSQDLTRDFEPTPTRVSRSKSLLETSLSQRKQNVKPNLQISAETHKLLARAGYIKEQKEHQEEEMDDFPISGTFPIIKQAETVNPRRESIIQLRKNNAGFVKSNVKQFDKISETKDIVNRHASPLRFANSTSRKKGQSPLRIPSAFSTTDGMALMKDKLHFGTALVPISTQLIKPSSVSEAADVVEETISGLKRKPSVYYTEREGIASFPNRYRNAFNKLACEKISEEKSSEDFSEMDTSKDDIFDCKTEHEISVFEDRNFTRNDISSLTTPGDKALTSTVELCDIDKENALEYGVLDNSQIKSVIATPLNADTSSLRTATNKTPIDILKTVKVQRSPVKPLKRLQSPHSPRCKKSRSPKAMRSRAPPLSTTLNQSDDFNNL